MRTPQTPLGRLDGLLFFPVTAFAPDGSFDPAGYRAHVEARLAAGPAAVFAACGTALAAEYALAAERAGADGLLVFPPSGADGGQAGLIAHYRALAAATPLDLILYQRDQLVFAPETVVELAAVPNIIGLKDGRGDLDQMQRIVSAVRTAGVEDFQYFNGMPTAEATQRAYRAIGVPLYSSAVFCFAPDVALAFHGALDKGDAATLDKLIDVFFRPYVELRRRHPGYAVSLVKALTVASGHAVGGVRAPLTEPAAAHVEEAWALVEQAREALA